MSERSFNTSQTASAFYDPDSWSWRTCQGSLLSEVFPLLERLPDWGTTADGALCVQAIPVRLIAVRDGSASPNLPTPRSFLAHMYGRALLTTETRQNFHANLEEVIALLPTPTPTTVDAKVFGPNVDWQLRLSNHAPHTASVLMNLPSNDGNGSSDDQHPPLPIAEDCDPSSSSG